MFRRLVLVLPCAALVGVVLGAALPGRLSVAAMLAVVIGLALALWLRAGTRRSIRTLAAGVGRLPRDPSAAFPLDDPDWGPLEQALTDLRAALLTHFRELRSQRERLETLLERLPPAILLFSDDGLTYANAKARDAFALHGQQVRTPMQVLGIKALADAVAQARGSDRSVDVEVEHHGRSLLARASQAPEGEVALVINDVTQMRRLDAVRSDFVTNASHELKTPVAGIQALAESLGLAFHRDPDRAERMIERLHEEAMRLAQLVRELLDLSRLEEAPADRGRRRVDFSAIVRGQVERVRPMAEDRGIEITLDSPAGTWLTAVPEDLRLIAGNLVENAVAYNRDRGWVRVTLRRAEEQVCLEVADTGIGIAGHEQDRIFERFYRVDKARSRAIGGTGLGLSLVRHATRRHGGTVSVESVLGNGSTFRVVLPVAAEPRDGPAT